MHDAFSLSKKMRRRNGTKYATVYDYTIFNRTLTILGMRTAYIQVIEVCIWFSNRVDNLGILHSSVNSWVVSHELLF